MTGLEAIAGWPGGRRSAGWLAADGRKETAGDLDEPYRLASVTKLLSTMAVLVAVEEGSVELDEPAGQHFVALGEPAVPALVSLLDDTTRLEYGGSKEATVGNSYAYRVKDFAAFYLSRIRNLPFDVVQDPAARDKAIDALRQALT